MSHEVTYQHFKTTKMYFVYLTELLKLKSVPSGCLALAVHDVKDHNKRDDAIMK